MIWLPFGLAKGGGEVQVRLYARARTTTPVVVFAASCGIDVFDGVTTSFAAVRARRS